VLRHLDEPGPTDLGEPAAAVYGTRFRRSECRVVVKTLAQRGLVTMREIDGRRIVSGVS
jgi:hypothetical protein